jgi:hypothetical protein
MDTLLLAITLFAVTIALVASAVAWRFARDARAHAAARIAALSAAAGPVPGSANEAVDSLPRPVPAATAERALEDFLPDGPATHGPAAVTMGDRFLGSTDAAPSAGPQRWLAAAAGVLLVLLLGATLARTSGRAAVASGAPAAASGASTVLELVAMRHQWRGGQLALEGEVRTPGGRPPAGLEAVALLFDRDGALVTSAVAPVATTTDDAPARFTVALAAPATVARYRVSFRTGGGLVPHVDLRGGTPPPTQASVTR